MRSTLRATGAEPAWAPPHIYREGWSACLAGEPRVANPYERGGTWNAAWVVGWDDAQRERSKDIERGMDMTP